MKEFQELKKKQLAYLNNVNEFTDIVNMMGQSGVDLLEETLRRSSYLIDADGLAKQLQNPNISLSVVAEVANGKSTFLNALIFKDQVLHSGLGAVTARLFKIDYGEDYTLTTNDTTNTYPSLDVLKDAARKLNMETREKMDKKKEASESDVQEVGLTLPHNALKDGITIYDTPGFGALDEALVYPIIQKSVAKSDAVIMLLDISQGIKKGEDRFVKDVLKSIPADKRFVIFNKIDAAINEDQMLLMGEDELNEQLRKVKNDTLDQLSRITGIPQDKIVNYSLSASKALAGFKLKDQKKIDDSYFEAFESDFWHRVVNSKREVFENRIITYTKLIENCSNTVGEVKKSLEKNHLELKNLQHALIERKAEFSAFSNKSISSLDSKIKEFTLDNSTVFNVETLLSSLQVVLEESVYDSLDDINWVDKLKVWSLKDKYVSKIEAALLDAKDEIQESVETYMAELVSKLYESQEGINKTINTINKKIVDFSDLGVTPLANIDILKQDENGQYSFDPNANFSEYISLDKEVFVIIGGIVAEIIAGRLVFLIPGLGLAIGAAFFTIMKVWKTYNDPNKELAKKVAKSVTEALRESLTVESSKYRLQTNEIKNAMSLALLSAKAKLKMIENSFENPEEREQELRQLQEWVGIIDGFENQLDGLKESK